jgi:hypothetical protein
MKPCSNFQMRGGERENGVSQEAKSFDDQRGGGGEAKKRIVGRVSLR